MNPADVIVLLPWLLFGIGVAAICARLLSGRRASRDSTARPPSPSGARPPPAPGEARDPAQAPHPARSSPPEENTLECQPESS